MGTNVYIKSAPVNDIKKRMSVSDYEFKLFGPFSSDEHVFLLFFGEETFVFKNPKDIFPIKKIPINCSIWYELKNDTYVVCDDNNILIPFTTFREMMEFLECKA